MFVQIGDSEWGREDYFDLGPGYRALVGLPGGFSSPLMSSLRQANLHNMTLVPGYGSDADTLQTDTVLVMDSVAFPFHQAEMCLQFHNLQSGTPYPDDYHALRPILQKQGRLVDNKCPQNYVC